MVFKGALLLGDISGFTAITELLSRSGKQGTEELSILLNSYFDKMLSLVEKHNGSVITFSGDSLLVRFDEKENALKCAETMLEAMDSFSNISILDNKFALKAKVVVGTGQWNQFIIGNNEKAHLLLSGELIKELARREADASADALIHFHCTAIASKIPLSSPPTNDEAFLSPGSERLFGEHRSVTAAFLSVYTKDSGHNIIENFQKLYLDISKCVSRFGGYLHHIDDMLPGGSRILILFGAPVSLGNDTLNSLMAIRELFSDRQDRYGFGINCGIDTGYAFSGMVGNKNRMQYTVIGDSVNTAARLADNTAIGTINVSESVYNRTRAHFAFTELPGITVKGKNKPLKRFEPAGRLSFNYKSIPFVGRKRELKEVLDLVINSDKIILLSGNAGIGKSFFLNKLTEVISEKGFTVIKAERTSHGPENEIFLSLVENICRITREMDSIQRGKQLHTFLSATQKKELITREVFLARMLFGLDFPNKTFDTLPPKLRRENLLEAISILINGLSLPACIIVEDIHYSHLEEIVSLQEVVRTVLRNSDSHPCFLLSTRPDTRDFLTKDTMVHECILEGLEQQQSFDLLAGVAGEIPINDEILLVLTERSQGNPFFLVQFFLYLQEKHLIILKDNSWEKTSGTSLESLPESIFSMIMARIDSLAETSRESLKVASVIGVKFDESLIRQIIRRNVHSDLVESNLAGLTYQFELSELEYLFSHMLIRDVAYDSMLREWRKQVHRNIGFIFEKTGSLKENRSRILAYHFERAEEWEKAVKHSINAGKLAAEEYRNHDALDHYATSIRIIEENAPELQRELAEANFLSGSVRELIGDYPIALTHYRKTVDFPSDIVLAGEATLGIANLLFTGGKPDEGMTLIDNLDEKLRLAGNTDMSLTLRIAAYRAWTYCVAGDIDSAMEKALLAVKIGESLECISEFTKAKRMGHALNTLATVHWAKGEYPQAKELYERAIFLALENDMKREAALTYGNIALVLQKQGNFRDAILGMEKQLTMSTEIGEKLLILSAHGGLCALNAELGNFEQALLHGKIHMKLSESISAAHDTLLACNHIAAIYCNMGKPDLALKFALKALELSKKSSYEREKAFTLSTLAELEIKKGEPSAAIDFLIKAEDLAANVHSFSLLQAILLTTAGVMISMGSLDKSEEKLEKVQELLKKTEMQTGIAAYNCTMGEVRAAQGRMGEALASFNLGISVFKKFGVRPAQAKACRSFASLLTKLDSKFLSHADHYMNEAAAIYMDMNLPGEAEKCEIK